MSMKNSRLNPIGSENLNCYECYAQLFFSEKIGKIFHLNQINFTPRGKRHSPL